MHVNVFSSPRTDYAEGLCSAAVRMQFFGGRSPFGGMGSMGPMGGMGDDFGGGGGPFGGVFGPGGMGGFGGPMGGAHFSIMPM